MSCHTDSLNGILLVFLFKDLFLLYVYGYFMCMYVSVHHMCEVPIEARRGFGILQSLSGAKGSR